MNTINETIDRFELFSAADKLPVIIPSADGRSAPVRTLYILASIWNKYYQSAADTDSETGPQRLLLRIDNTDATAETALEILKMMHFPDMVVNVPSINFSEADFTLGRLTLDDLATTLWLNQHVAAGDRNAAMIAYEKRVAAGLAEKLFVYLIMAAPLTYVDHDHTAGETQYFDEIAMPEALGGGITMSHAARILAKVIGYEFNEPAYYCKGILNTVRLQKLHIIYFSPDAMKICGAGSGAMKEVERLLGLLGVAAPSLFYKVLREGIRALRLDPVDYGIDGPAWSNMWFER